MRQHYTDKKTGIRYTLQGDYYLHGLALPDKKETLIGLWGSDTYDISSDTGKLYTPIR